MVVIEDSSFQQTIEYSGKSGSVLSFIYSEYVEVKPRIIGAVKSTPNITGERPVIKS